MAKELVNVVGTTTQDNLIAHIDPPVYTTGINLKAGSGSVERGTILTRDGKTAYYVVYGDVETVGSVATPVGSPSIILADPVELQASAPTPGVGYRAGCFNINAVKVKDGYELSQDDVDELRKNDIILSDMLS